MSLLSLHDVLCSGDGWIDRRDPGRAQQGAHQLHRQQNGSASDAEMDHPYAPLHRPLREGQIKYLFK